MATAEPEHVPPVFLLGKTLPAVEEKEYSVFEICTAAERVTGFSNVVGAQRIGALWRLYPKTLNARMNLLTKGLVLRGHCIQTRDKNPFIIRDENGEERETPSVRLTIGNIPLSFSNEEIMNFIGKMPGVKTRSRLMDERARDESGKLSHFKTGRRFVYIDTPGEPLPKSVKLGVFQASLYHPGQKTAMCSNCLASGHHVTACTAVVRCKQCLQYGHKQGDTQCQLAPSLPTPACAEQPTEGRETTAKDQQTPTTEKPKKQTTLPGLIAPRGRSATPPRGKRLRSPSVQRSPRSEGKKNARSEERKKQTTADHNTACRMEEQETGFSRNTNNGEADHSPPP